MQLLWPGLNENDSVIIALKPEDFCLAKNSIEITGDRFMPKKELHVTVIGSKLGLILQQEIKLDQTIKQSLENTFENIDWSFKQTASVHMLSRSKNNTVEKSIIMRIEMPGMLEFYDQLKSLGLLEAGTPVPPPHVTLYTHHCPSGIGVPSDEILDILTTKILTLNPDIS